MKLDHTPGLYAIECLSTGKLYIGSTADLQNRQYQHWWHLGAGKHPNYKLQRAWDEHGEDQLAFHVLLRLPGASPERLVSLEACAVAKHRPWFNIATPALPSMAGRHHTEDAKRRIGLANKGGPGRPHPCSPETKAKIGAANRGRKHGPQNDVHRANISDGVKRYWTPERRAAQAERASKYWESRRNG